MLNGITLEVANLINESRKSNSVDIAYCRSQTYDGAGNMAGKQNEAARNFKKKSTSSLKIKRLLQKAIQEKVDQFTLKEEKKI